MKVKKRRMRERSKIHRRAEANRVRRRSRSIIIISEYKSFQSGRSSKTRDGTVARFSVEKLGSKLRRIHANE
jgi:hypothetical protein